MARWLYSSSGHPVAFIAGDAVFSRSGRFIGRLDGNEIWHGEYKGEIVHGDRLVRKTTRSRVVKGTPGTPGTPGIPGVPGSKGAIGLPGSYEDVEVEG